MPLIASAAPAGVVAEREPGRAASVASAPKSTAASSAEQPAAPAPTLRLPGPEARVDRRRRATSSDSHGGHAVTSPSPGSSAAGRPRAARSRKIALTSAGAAMKSTISAWSTVTSSSEMPAYDCIWLPPACSAPNSSAASTTPHGLARPSSATVIASKPMLRDDQRRSAAGRGAEHLVAPPRPASAPAISMTSDVRPADAHAGGPGGVRVGADRAQLEAEGASG